MYYNQKLISTLEDRFGKLFSEFDGVEDLYAFIASIMYDKKYVDCFEPDPLGKELRERAKQFILPVVEECGGLLENEMDELFRRLRASASAEGSYAVGEYGHSYKLLTHKDVKNIISYLKQYSDIKNIVDSWNTSDIAGDEQEVSQYFQQILDIFSEDN